MDKNFDHQMSPSKRKCLYSYVFLSVLFHWRNDIQHKIKRGTQNDDTQHNK